MKTFKSFAITLALSGFLTASHAQAKQSHSDDSAASDSGALEHYHHEYYSHSFVDSNYDDSQESISWVNHSKAKKGRYAGKANIGATIALGGHRHHPR